MHLHCRSCNDTIISIVRYNVHSLVDITSYHHSIIANTAQCKYYISNIYIININDYK